MNFSKLYPVKNMPYEKPKPEKQLIGIEERAGAEKKLKKIIETISQEMREQGVPIDENCRIKAALFKNVYSEKEIEWDNQWAEQKEADWYGDIPKEKIEQEKLKRSGEKLEMLKTAVFYKFLREKFIIARTSVYDDIKNKIDNIILEKETGNLVCALDEVGDTTGFKYEQKKQKILERNRNEQGGQLKYGLQLEKGKDNQIKFILGGVSHLPIFYLALPERHIQEGIRQLDLSFSGESDKTKKLFSFFIASIKSQIKALKLEHHLNTALKNRLDDFEKALTGIGV